VQLQSSIPEPINLGNTPALCQPVIVVPRTSIGISFAQGWFASLQGVAGPSLKFDRAQLIPFSGWLSISAEQCVPGELQFEMPSGGIDDPVCYASRTLRIHLPGKEKEKQWKLNVQDVDSGGTGRRPPAAGPPGDFSSVSPAGENSVSCRHSAMRVRARGRGSGREKA